MPGVLIRYACEKNDTIRLTIFQTNRRLRYHAFSIWHNQAIITVIAQIRQNILDNLDTSQVPPEIYGELLNEDDDALIVILKTLDEG